MKKILWGFLVLMVCCPLSLWAQKQLTFKNGKFKIAQFTDIHWDETTENCARTIASIQAVIKAENPDVAMLTGDVVTARPSVEGWKSVIKIFEDAKLPYTVMMGNHDAENLDKDSIYDLLATSPYFIGEKGPKDIYGVGNYVVPVYGSKGGNKPCALLYCIDSNDYPKNQMNYGGYDWIHFDQIAWYREQSTKFTKANGGKPLPALAFFHIPLLEYNQVIGAETTLGRKEEDGVGSPNINSGFFTSLIEMGDVMGTFCGHDHVNDYIGIQNNIALAYGRVSGWDAYGDFERGGRIIELTEGEYAFDSWIRTPTKREYTYYYPSGLTSKDEESMTYLPAKKETPNKQGVAYTYYEGKVKHTDQIASLKKKKEGTMKNISIKDAAAKDHFAYVFRTWVKIPERGVYRFYSYSDDGSKLLIDGQTIVDNNGSHSAAPKKGKVALEAGYHELTVLYFEDYMGESLEVGISSKHIKEMALPAEMLYLPR